jgi:hypothetical protein
MSTHPLSPRSLTWDRWSVMTPSEQIQAAESLLDVLPPDFEFIRIKTHRLGDQRHRMEMFEHGGMGFVLIPGGAVSVGFDVSSWRPSAQMTASFDGSAKTFGWKKTIKEHVAGVTARSRTAEIAPVLFGLALEAVDGCE